MNNPFDTPIHTDPHMPLTIYDANGRRVLGAFPSYGGTTEDQAKCYMEYVCWAVNLMDKPQVDDETLAAWEDRAKAMDAASPFGGAVLHNAVRDIRRHRATIRPLLAAVERLSDGDSSALEDVIREYRAIRAT